MATTIITKNGSGAPVAGDLVQGELAVDLTNKEVYTKDSNGVVVKVGSASDDSGIPEAPEDGKQYAREDAAWTEVPPAGISDAPSDGKQYAREDSTWSEITAPQDGVPEAPEDGKQYAREDATWTEITLPQGGVPEAPEDGKQYAREDAAWTEVVPATPTTSLPASAITDGAMAYTGSINITGDIGGTNLTAASSVTSSGKVKARDFIETVREPRYQGGAATLELDLANNFTMDFSAATGYVLGLSGTPSAAGDAYGCTLTLDTTNMDALVWDDKIKWSGGTAPALTAGVTYVFTLITTDGGTTFKGFVGGEAFA